MKACILSIIFKNTSSCNKKLSNYWPASQNPQNCMATFKLCNAQVLDCILLLAVSIILLQSVKFQNMLKWNMAVCLGRGFPNSKPKLKKPKQSNKEKD